MSSVISPLVVDGYVEINPDKDFLAGYIGIRSNISFHHKGEEVAHPAGKSPFVVIPGKDLHHLFAQYEG